MEMVPFGEALKCIRRERGLSLRELSKLSGVDHGYISRLERGEKIYPSQKVIGSIYKALKIKANIFKPVLCVPDPGINHLTGGT